MAEGLETAQELRICAEAGCDFAQGFLVCKPELDASRLRTFYAGARARTSYAEFRQRSVSHKEEMSKASS